ncbi:hypothetical protein O9929_26460 [Vibrio lentus]|nr:hypothetical protein [Vibrio lentus]
MIQSSSFSWVLRRKVSSGVDNVSSGQIHCKSGDQDTYSSHNQVGFLPKLDKYVQVENTDDTFEMDIDQLGRIDLGKTDVFGLNKASGERIHRVNFQNIQTLFLKVLTVKVDDDVSLSIRWFETMFIVS